MKPFFLLSDMTLLTFAAVCAVSDYLTFKIPNRLILCGLFCALVTRAGLLLPSLRTALPDGLLPAARLFLAQMTDAGGGFLLPYLLLGAFAYLKMLGGGDVKLLSVIGLQTGTAGCLTVIWFTFIAAAGVSAAVVLHRRNLPKRLDRLKRYVNTVRLTGKAVPYRSLSGEDSAGGEFAFAVPVFLALTVYLMRQLPARQ